MTGVAEDRSWIREMWTFLGHDDNTVIDPLWDVDRHFRDLARLGTTHELVAELDAALATERNGEVPMSELSLEYDDGPIDDGPGGSAELLRGLRHRALAVAARPARVPDTTSPTLDGVEPPRTSGFTDEGTARAVAQRFSDRHTEDVSALLSPGSGWSAVSFYQDLPDLGTIGWVRDARGSHGSEPGIPRPVSAAVAVVALDDAGVPLLTHLRPEIALDGEVRQRFPALCHFWGGWFHPHDGYAIRNVVDVMRATRPPALDLVRDELDRLLAEHPDDDRCRAVAEACGSLVLPQRARHWVDLLRWRFDGYDWRAGR